MQTSKKADFKMIKCRKCDYTKKNCEFRPKRRVCKECERAHGRAYRKSNNKAKEWAQENKKRMKHLQTRWYMKNKESINDKFKEKYHGQNQWFKKIKNYRTAICHMLKKTQKTNKYVGCDSPFLIKWISSCFKEGMTLENYGSYWTVDHVIPLDWVQEDEKMFAMISKWYNIRPVVKRYNLTKNKYLDVNQVIKHKKNYKRFCKKEEIKRDKKYKRYLQNTLMRETP